jgi:hypothetical protein
MAFDSGTTFGKREIHRVWSDRARAGETVSVSAARGWLAVGLLALASAGLGWLAFTLVGGAQSRMEILLAIAAALASFALLWVALRVAASVTRPGPVLRLDPNRLVLRSASGQIVLPWEDVSLSLGRMFLSIRVGRRAPPGDAPPQDILVPVLLLPGGAAGVRQAIDRVRPGALAE